MVLQATERSKRPVLRWIDLSEGDVNRELDSRFARLPRRLVTS
jgi:hypothetical protein